MLPAVQVKGPAGPALIVGPGDGTVQCLVPKLNEALGDTRDTFDTSGYVGIRCAFTLTES
jgi:hypothetical protein